jgi:nucleoside-diphosphate-sugar epimerase
MNVLITGGNGYIAQQLYPFLKTKYNVSVINRSNFDLTDSKAVNDYFNNKFFDVVIHTAVTGGSRLKNDNWNMLDNNLQMYYNLLRNNSNYKKFIHLTSGAEIYAQETPYGFSKYTISKSVLEKENFFNIRIFAVFNENEKDTRFIKANILRYINKQPIEIYENRIMDFFYMEDFCKLIDFYITNLTPPKNIDCTYSDTLCLQQIADIINNLDKHKVDIILKNNSQIKYSGVYTPIVEYDGLEQGIKKTFLKIKNANIL